MATDELEEKNKSANTMCHQLLHSFGNASGISALPYIQNIYT